MQCCSQVWNDISNSLTKDSKMNRKNIAKVEMDPDGVLWWCPTERFRAMGVRPTSLGPAPTNYHPEWLWSSAKDGNYSSSPHGKTPTEFREHMALRDRIVVLNGIARSLLKQDRTMRLVARAIADRIAA
jgi:hypothetical protein